MADRKNKGYDAEDMTVDIELDNGENVSCKIITIMTVGGRDYIALLPIDENGENNDGEVWLYRYSEDKNNPSKEPLIEYIENDDEYEIVEDAFDEYLDEAEFDELVDEYRDDETEE